MSQCQCPLTPDGQIQIHNTTCENYSKPLEAKAEVGGMLSTHLGLLRMAILSGDPKKELLLRVDDIEKLPERTRPAYAANTEGLLSRMRSFLAEDYEPDSLGTEGQRLLAEIDAALRGKPQEKPGE